MLSMASEFETPFAARLFRILSDLRPEERAHAWVQATQFLWPDAITQFKPTDCDLLESARKYDDEDWKSLFRCLELLTSDYERSRQWNIEVADNNVRRHLESYIDTHFPQ